MDTKTRLRTAAGTLTAMFALVALSRCSPVAHSLPKSMFAKPKAGDTPELSLPAEPIQDLTATNHPIILMVSYKSTLIEAGTRDEEESRLSPEPGTRIRSIIMTDTQVDEFRRNGKLEFQLDGKATPESVHGIFEMGMNRLQMHLQGMEDFESDLNTKDGVTWTLSIPSNVDSEISRRMRDHLLGIEIVMTEDLGDGAETLGPHPAPSASPSPAPKN